MVVGYRECIGSDRCSGIVMVASLRTKEMVEQEIQRTKDLCEKLKARGCKPVTLWTFSFIIEKLEREKKRYEHECRVTRDSSGKLHV
jgi:hypothetical protein